jgi:hypothetical protein
VYDDQMRRFLKGAEITVMVFFAGSLEECRIRQRQPGTVKDAV